MKIFKVSKNILNIKIAGFIAKADWLIIIGKTFSNTFQVPSNEVLILRILLIQIIRSVLFLKMYPSLFRLQNESVVSS